MKIGWATDLHLEFVSPKQFKKFSGEVNEAEVDLLIVTGDLSNGRQLARHLIQLVGAIDPPIHFVLGNHDFYEASFLEIESKIQVWAQEACCHYIDNQSTPLDDETWLIGLNGWADGTAGLSAKSTIQLNDYFQIGEFIGLPIPQRFELLKKLGENNAKLLKQRLENSRTAGAQKIIFATHVPPFAEAAWHEGQASDPKWSPHFSAPLVGKVLLDWANAHPEIEIKVLCGHTHGVGLFEPAPNLSVYTGGAVYGKPVLQAVIEKWNFIAP